MTPEELKLCKALDFLSLEERYNISQLINLAVKAETEACANLYENIDPACDHEIQNGIPGAGAMGAILRYRDAIRARGGEK